MRAKGREHIARAAAFDLNKGIIFKGHVLLPGSSLFIKLVGVLYEFMLLLDFTAAAVQRIHELVQLMLILFFKISSFSLLNSTLRISWSPESAEVLLSFLLTLRRPDLLQYSTYVLP